MKIVFTPRGFMKCGLHNVQVIKDAGFDVEYNDTGKQYTKEEFYEKTRDADGVVVGVEIVDREYIDAHPNVKAIVKFGVGTDNIDLDYCKEKGVFVGRTVGSNARSVAETAISYVLMDSKHLYENVSETRSYGWAKPTGYEIENKVIGIIGFGAIGKRVAQMAFGLGMKVLAYDPYFFDKEAAAKFDVKEASFDEIIESADFVSLHLPLNESTKDLIAEKELKRMKNSAVLINTARGGIVNEADLYKALCDKVIRSAYFDVLVNEPPKSDEPLISLPNFYLTPHIASRSNEAERTTADMATRITIDALNNYKA